MNAQTKRVNREEILEYIKDLFIKEGQEEMPISATHLAKVFGITQPTMDYHLKNLVKAGSLIQTAKFGKYNRKIYRLPRKIPVVTPLNKEVTPDVLNKLLKIKQDLQEKKKPVEGTDMNQFQESYEKESKEVQETENILVPENVEVEASKDPEYEPDLVIHKDNQVYNVEVKHIQEEMEAREKTLDEQIDDFLLRSKAIPAPQDILKKDDREILAVMNETIHQNMAYLRNLEDQLSTVQNKEMILNLVDDRTKLLNDLKEQQELNKNLMQENQMLRSQQKEKEASIDPGRIRLMQQVMVATIDNFVEQPNHSIALGRYEFRKQLNKEINDMVRYVLGLEK